MVHLKELGGVGSKIRLMQDNLLDNLCFFSLLKTRKKIESVDQLRLGKQMAKIMVSNISRL